ncbi:CoA transferase [Streptosporangium sp. NPDC002544]|uniref:CaiB/BaiF CoA transferase family protein n=1 Tax=Streptosporangium sp. NPDC002544 TaxID=3154538 RepID=UPI00331F57BB
MTHPILEGLTVLEFGAGSQPTALAGVLLADNGARVIKVEPPEGDRLRTSSPSAFLVFNRGKESVVADLRTPEGRERARSLAATADVLIEGFAPGVAEEFGIGYDDLRELNPGLVHCSITGFGSTGPYAGLKAYEHVVQAKAGTFTLGAGGVFGYRPGPIFINAPIASTGAGHLAVSGIVAALVAREQSGRGQRVEATLLQGITPSDYFGTMEWQSNQGLLPTPQRAGSGSGGTKPPATVAASRYSYMPCTKDGRWVFFTALLPHQAAAVLRALGREHILAEPRFRDAPRFPTAEDAQAFEDEIWTAFRQRTFAEWDERLRAEPDVAYELARTSEEGLDHSQVRHNGEVVLVNDPRVGIVEQVGPLANFQATPARIIGSAPAVGQSRPLPAEPAAARESGPSPEHPLAGFTVVEFGYFYAMPFGTALAASLGARVIKIEDRRGDPMRFSFGVPETGSAKTMEGKESISVDLRTPEGRQVVHDLVAKADAFVNGFRPGVAERQGVDYETLSKINPKLVYLHSAGYGTEGEFANRPIFAQCASSVAGAVHRQAGFWLDSALTEGMDVPELQAVILPRLRGYTDGDSNAALVTCTSLVLALYHKRRTGQGQFLSTSMLGGNLWAYADDAVRYEGKPEAPMTDADLHGLHALYRLYQAAEGWVFLAAPRQQEWETLARALDRSDLLEDPRFSTGEQRSANDDALIGELETVFRGRDAEEWESDLAPRGIACVAVFEDTNSAFTNTDPVLKETGLVAEVDHPLFGRILRHGLPVRLSETPGRLAGGCLVGQHTRAVLTELGYTAEQIAALEAKEAVFSATNTV